MVVQSRYDDTDVREDMRVMTAVLRLSVRMRRVLNGTEGGTGESISIKNHAHR